MNKFILAVAISVSFFQISFAQEEVEIKHPNCFITIKYYQIIGGTEQNVIEAETKDKMECKKNQRSIRPILLLI
ncbi:MAG: hypothetical protein U0T83_09200 [Bacteriovoracaceae bacterium]